MKRKTHVDNSLVLFRLKMVKVRINGRLEVAHKIIMEISLLIMEKSWNNHGILISNFCGNPERTLVPEWDTCSLYGFQFDKLAPFGDSDSY